MTTSSPPSAASRTKVLTVFFTARRVAPVAENQLCARCEAADSVAPTAPEVRRMNVEFVASFSPIVRDPQAARELYGDGLGLTFERSDGDYVFTEQLSGVRHFGLWPLTEAAQ